MNKKSVKVGDKVTCKTPTAAYYSDYAGNPVCIFKPGMVGVAAVVDVPSVCREGVSFICVDFRVPGLYSGGKQHKQDTWRVALKYDNIVKVK